MSLSNQRKTLGRMPAKRPEPPRTYDPSPKCCDYALLGPRVNVGSRSADYPTALAQDSEPLDSNPPAVKVSVGVSGVHAFVRSPQWTINLHNPELSVGKRNPNFWCSRREWNPEPWD